MAEGRERAVEVRPRRFRPYPEYRDSGVEWLGEIPAHWEANPLKRSFRVVNGSTPKSGEPDNWDGDIPWVTPEDLGRLSERVLNKPARCITRKGYETCGTRMVPAGSLVLSTRAPIGHFAISGTSICTNQGCRSLVFRHPGNETYTYFQLYAGRPMLEAAGRGSTFMELGKQDLESVALAVPPPDEQTTIAGFLDRETAKIDALVAKKERLIELLQEKRSALITRAVTRGLDPNVPTKESGVEWLGEIPTHWEPARLWRLCAAISGATPTRDNPAYWDGEIAWVSPKDMKRRMIATSEDLITRQAMDETGVKLIPPPVVLVVVRGMILAHTFPVAVTTAPVTINQDMKALRLADFVDPIYFAWALDGLAGGLIATVVEEAAHGTRAIRMDQWRNLVCPVPPRSEQRGISDFLKEKTAKIDALIGKIREAIDHLNEYRTALISAAVTGKIDVRNEAA